jgi:hypothetical protein
MRDHNLAAIHDRIDEEHFENHMHDQAIKALQDRVNLLEAAVRELRAMVFEREDASDGRDLVRMQHAQLRMDEPGPRQVRRTRSRVPRAL